MPSKDVSWLLEHKIDPFSVLQVQRNASPIEIRKSYRSLALKHHPDKSISNKPDVDFNLISTAYSVLSTPNLKDEFLANFKPRNPRKRKPSTSLNDRIQTLKSQFNSIKSNYIQNSSTLLESQSIAIPCQVIVKWKDKSPIDQLTLKSLMEIFGPIESIELIKNHPQSDNYNYATITYTNNVSGVLASTHDYSKTSNIWSSGKLRKLSSLLRSVTLQNEIPSPPLNDYDYISQSIINHLTNHHQ